MKVLVVDDEISIRLLCRVNLEAEGFTIFEVGTRAEVVPAVHSFKPDVILLDLMLPGRRGIDVFADVRRIADIPVVMVTARVEEIDRLVGLELGADDYVCKPFSPREVVARVKAVLRRGRRASDSASGVMLDDERYQATLDGKRLDLTPVEFRLLKTLASRPGRIFPRAQLLDTLYEDHRVVSDRTVDSHVKNLRRKLEAARPGTDLIRSVYGVGYKLEV